MKKGDGKLRLGNEKPDFDGVASFGEIGKALGITKGGAWMLYCSAIRKLRLNARVKLLREIAAAKDEKGLD